MIRNLNSLANFDGLKISGGFGERGNSADQNSIRNNILCTKSAGLVDTRYHTISLRGFHVETIPSSFRN